MFKRLFYYLLLSFVLIASYIYFSRYWIGCGGINRHNLNIFIFEVPAILILLLIFYVPSKHIIQNAILSVAPIVGLYILYDAVFHFLARSPRASDLANVTMVSDFSIPLGIGFAMMVVSVFSIALYLFFKTSNSRVLIAAKIILLAGVLYYLNTEQFKHHLFKHFAYYNWSQASTIITNGRFTSFIYYMLKSEESQSKLVAYSHKNIEVDKLLFGDSRILDKKNIYIVVLESFVDPRLLKDISFNRSPLANELKKYLQDDKFSYTLSPIYGGGTSQAEFEILTGIRALAEVSSIEFNSLMGNQISGFVNVLKKNGYRAYAAIVSNSEYFNSKYAYSSIGFDKTVFMEETADYEPKSGDKMIFDGDLYKYAFQKIKQIEKRKPYLYYTLGMYGHIPFERNTALRPDMIQTTCKDDNVHRIANQFYYRTKALAKYIDEILSIDPSSIILITSDHLPSILTDDVKYTRKQKENISLLLIDGKTVDISGKHYYEIPRYLYKRLSNDKTDVNKLDFRSEEEIYFKALSESLTP